MNTTTMTWTKLNGIDSVGQAATIEAIRKSPNLGKVRFRSRTTWDGATRTSTVAGDFDGAGSRHKREGEHRTHTDMPLPFLGSDQAAAPVEIALHALASCLSSTLVYHCTARGIEVRSVTAEIDADLDAWGFLRLDDSTDSGFESVNITLHADADAPVEELVDIVERAPMFDVFTRSIPVNAKVRATA